MMAKGSINRAAVVKKNIFSYLSCKLVSKPAEYTQAAGQHDIKRQTLHYIRMVTQTLSYKTVYCDYTLASVSFHGGSMSRPVLLSLYFS
jgi:hypothetical protein